MADFSPQDDRLRYYADLGADGIPHATFYDAIAQAVANFPPLEL